MLDTKYRVYHNPSTGAYTVRTTAYALPRILHKHVSVVAPTTYFGGMRRMRATHHLQADGPIISDSDAAAQIQSVGQGSNAAVPASCENMITPACLQALYNTTGYTPQAIDVNQIGVAGYLEEFANDADLQVSKLLFMLCGIYLILCYKTFFKKFLPEAANTGFALTHVEVNGGENDQTMPGVEANLDVQYTLGMAFPTPETYFRLAFHHIFSFMYLILTKSIALGVNPPSYPIPKRQRTRTSRILTFSSSYSTRRRILRHFRRHMEMMSRRCQRTSL